MIKQLLLSILFTVSLLANDPEKEFVQNLEKMIHAAEKSWPGFTLSHPIVISFDNGHLYGFQLKNPDKAWQKIDKDIWFLANDPWGIAHIPFSPFHPLNNEKVMIFHVAKDDKTALFAVVHENFHLHQFAHFPPPVFSEGYRDHLDPTNLALIEMEEASLIHYLRAKSDPQEFLKDFLAVNQVRQLLMAPSSINWEYHQQLMEGLADYASYRLFETVGLKWPQTPIETLTKPIPNLSDYAIKWRHYGMGSTLAMALDALKVPHWQETVEKTGKSPGEFLKEALPLSASEILDRFDLARIQQHFTSLHDHILREVAFYTSEVHEHLTAHEKAPGTIIRLSILRNQGSAGGGENLKSYYLPQGGTLALRDTSNSISNDQSWNLKLVNIAHLFIKAGGVREFKLQDDTTIDIDGETLLLNDLAAHPKIKSFFSMSWSSKQGEFHSVGNEGLLEVDEDGVVTILF